MPKNDFEEGRIGGGYVCLRPSLAGKGAKLQLLPWYCILTGLARNDRCELSSCRTLGRCARISIRHGGNEPCFVFFWKEKHRAGARHCLPIFLNALHRCRYLHHAQTRTSSLISLIASAYLPISYSARDIRTEDLPPC